jgi:acetyltransferase-like isoleucine patch superfamily enzyme
VLTDFVFLWKHRERPRTARRQLVVWAKRTLLFFALTHLLLRSALLRGRGARIGRMAVVGHARIGGHLALLEIGEESSLGRCELSLHERIVIGRRVVINDGVVILTASHDIRSRGWTEKAASVTVEDYAWIATNAILLPGTRVGRGAVVGAGAVVRGTIPAYGVVVGNPAVLLSTRRCEDLEYSPVSRRAPVEAWVGRAQRLGEP